MLAERIKKWPERWEEKGRQEGRQETQREAALKMIRRTEMSDEMIAEILGLEAEAVARLRRDEQH